MFSTHQGLHPRVITDGLNEGKKKALEVLEKMKVPVESDREKLLDVARTSLQTKIHHKIAKVLTEVVFHALPRLAGIGSLIKVPKFCFLDMR
jgi:T-complex protein 1 subunit zeta